MPDERLIADYSFATASEFYTQVKRAFADLTRQFELHLSSEQIESPRDYQDTEAVVAYRGDHVGIDVAWFFNSALIYVRLIAFQAGSTTEIAHTCMLQELAGYLGHGDDSDFVQGDADRVDGRSITKRFNVLQSNLSGILEGLARATERYGSDILSGDTTVFPAVQAYATQKLAARHP